MSHDSLPLQPHPPWKLDPEYESHGLLDVVAAKAPPSADDVDLKYLPSHDKQTSEEIVSTQSSELTFASFLQDSSPPPSLPASQVTDIGEVPGRHSARSQGPRDISAVQNTSQSSLLFEHASDLTPLPELPSYASVLSEPISSELQQPPQSPVTPASTKPKRVFAKKDKTNKPHFSYAALIGQAINSKSNKRISLNDIYNYISGNYPYYKRDDAGWQNSIRHNLSLNECFRKSPRADTDAPGKGSLWVFTPGVEDMFENGGFQKRGKKGAATSKTAATSATQKLPKTPKSPSKRAARKTAHPSQTSSGTYAQSPEQAVGDEGSHEDGYVAAHHRNREPRAQLSDEEESAGSSRASTATTARSATHAQATNGPVVDGKRVRRSTQKAQQSARTLAMLDEEVKNDDSMEQGDSTLQPESPDASVPFDMGKGVETRSAHKKRRSVHSVASTSNVLSSARTPVPSRAMRRQRAAKRDSRQETPDFNGHPDYAEEYDEGGEVDEEEMDDDSYFEDSYQQVPVSLHRRNYSSASLGPPANILASPSRFEALTSIASLASGQSPPDSQVFAFLPPDQLSLLSPDAPVSRVGGRNPGLGLAEGAIPDSSVFTSSSQALRSASAFGSPPPSPFTGRGPTSLRDDEQQMTQSPISSLRSHFEPYLHHRTVEMHDHSPQQDDLTSGDEKRIFRAGSSPPMTSPGKRRRADDEPDAESTGHSRRFSLSSISTPELRYQPMSPDHVFRAHERDFSAAEAASRALQMLQQSDSPPPKQMQPPGWSNAYGSPKRRRVEDVGSPRVGAMNGHQQPQREASVQGMEH